VASRSTVPSLSRSCRRTTNSGNRYATGLYPRGANAEA
jgi:hypothetical protein